VLKTILNALIDFKHFELGAREKSLALFDDSVGGNPHKIFGFHLFSLAKQVYSNALLRIFPKFTKVCTLV